MSYRWWEYLVGLLTLGALAFVARLFVRPVKTVELPRAGRLARSGAADGDPALDGDAEPSGDTAASVALVDLAVSQGLDAAPAPAPARASVLERLEQQIRAAQNPGAVASADVLALFKRAKEHVQGQWHRLRDDLRRDVFFEEVYDAGQRKTTWKNYIRGGGMLVAMKVRDSWGGDNTTYLLSDHLGSATNYTYGSGNSLVATSYDASGDRCASHDPIGSATANSLLARMALA